MCNDYEREIEWRRYVAALEQARLDVPADADGGQLPRAADVRVKDVAPVFNFRSDGRDFSDSKRCGIPTSAFFEFTGTRSPKSKWRFTLKGEDVFGVAGLWREGSATFTMLTTASSCCRPRTGARGFTSIARRHRCCGRCPPAR